MNCFLTPRSKPILLAALFIGTALPLTLRPTVVAAGDDWFFASDIHEYGDSRLKPILQNEMPGSYDVVALVGDYQKNFSEDTSSYDNILDMVDTYKSSSAMAILTQGNHDVNCPSSHNCYTHSTGGVEPPTQYSKAYVINEEDFCDLNTSQLGGYLLAQWTDPVIFVVSHYPLHSPRISGQCKTKALEIFDTLQFFGSFICRDIVYVWGHNHSNSSYDDGVDYTMLPGDLMPSNVDSIYDEIEGATMNFTYLNAGYIKGIDLGEASWIKVSVSQDWISVDRHGDDATFLFFNRGYN